MKLDIHDHFFRQQFSRRQVALDFVEQLLPPEIVVELDLETLEISQDSFADKDQRVKHSDLIYSFRKKDGTPIYITILLEHKSWKPRRPHLQLLRYELGIWEADDRERGKPLRQVVPVIFYHGTQKWKYEPFLASFEGVSPAFERFIPRQDYILIDMKRKSDDEIMGLRDGLLVNSLLAFKHYKDQPWLLEKGGRLFFPGNAFQTAEEGRDFFEEMLKYYISICQTDQKTLLEKIIPGLSLTPKDTEMAKSIAEQIRQEGHQEGHLKGHQEGIQEGRQEAFRETARTMMHNFPNWDDQKIAELLALPVEFVREIRREFLSR